MVGTATTTTKTSSTSSSSSTNTVTVGPAFYSHFLGDCADTGGAKATPTSSSTTRSRADCAAACTNAGDACTAYFYYRCPQAARCRPVCKSGSTCYYTDSCKDAVSGLSVSSTYKKYNFYYKSDSSCSATKDCDSCTDALCEQRPGGTYKDCTPDANECRLHGPAAGSVAKGTGPPAQLASPLSTNLGAEMRCYVKILPTPESCGEGMFKDSAGTCAACSNTACAANTFRTGTCSGSHNGYAFLSKNSGSMFRVGLFLISLGAPHVRPMWPRTATRAGGQTESN